MIHVTANDLTCSTFAGSGEVALHCLPPIGCRSIQSGSFNLPDKPCFVSDTGLAIGSSQAADPPEVWRHVEAVLNVGSLEDSQYIYSCCNQCPSCECKMRHPWGRHCIMCHYLELRDHPVQSVGGIMRKSAAAHPHFALAISWHKSLYFLHFSRPSAATVLSSSGFENLKIAETLQDGGWEGQIPPPPHEVLQGRSPCSAELPVRGLAIYPQAPDRALQGAHPLWYWWGLSSCHLPIICLRIISKSWISPFFVGVLASPYSSLLCIAMPGSDKPQFVF